MGEWAGNGGWSLDRVGSGEQIWGVLNRRGMGNKGQWLLQLQLVIIIITLQVMTTIDKQYLLRKPKLRKSFIPLEIDNQSGINLQTSAWTWIRAFFKPRGQKVQIEAIYTKIKDKCYFPKTVEAQTSFWARNYEQIDKYIHVYEPQHPLLLIWYFIIITFLYLHFFEIPLAIFFWNIVYIDEFNTTWSLAFNYVSLFLFTMDILIKFNTAYYKHGLIVLSRESIVNRYFSWRFWVDIACLIILYVYVFADASWMIYVKIFFYTKLYQTSEYDHHIQNAFELNILFISIYRLLRIIGIFILYSHIMACGYFYLDYYLYENNPTYLSQGLLWLTNSSALPMNMIENYDWYVWYQYAMYWALQTATTVGYGDITPKNPQEVLYVIINMIFMCVIFGYFINSIWEIIGDWGDKSKRYKENFSNLNRYLKNKGVSQGLEQKLRAYLDYLWRQDTIDDIESTIMDKLTPGLRDELTLNIKYPFFLKLRFFNNLETKQNKQNFGVLKMNLANAIKEERYSQDEIICAAGSADERLFYIIEGKVELSIKTFTSHVLTTENFGQYQFITQQAHTADAHAIKYSSLYFLEKSVFLQQIMLYSDIHQLHKEIKDKVLYNMNFTSTSITCPYCFERHLVTKCPDLVYIPEPKEDLDGYIQSRKRFDRNSHRLEIVGRHGEEILFINEGDFEQCVAEYGNYFREHNISGISK